MTKRKRNSIETETVLEIERVKNIILERLYGKEKDPQLVGLDKQFNNLYNTLEKTITTGESNSLLLVGPRSAGKSTLVSKALNILEAQYNGHNGKIGDSEKRFITIKLSGSINYNDRLALKSIALQLCHGIGVDEVANKSAAEWMTLIVELFQSGDRGSTPVIFILEDFEIFAMQPRQLLLYTLFDIAQSRQAPIAVVGLTRRMNVMDMLEKRVKSRFSHRQILVPLLSSIEQFLELTLKSLFIPAAASVSSEFAKKFNDSCKTLIYNSKFSEVITSIFEYNKDIRLLYRILSGAIIELNVESPFPSLQILEKYATIFSEDSKSNILKGVSLLEFHLLIAMVSLTNTGYQCFNFEMIYNEYKNLINKYFTSSSTSGGSLKICKKSVALKAFEQLIQAELMCFTGGKSYAGSRSSVTKKSFDSTFEMREFQMMRLLIDTGTLSAAAKKRADLSAPIRRWFAE